MAAVLQLIGGQSVVQDSLQRSHQDYQIPHLLTDHPIDKSSIRSQGKNYILYQFCTTDINTKINEH